jgi:hypothetical protein
MREMKGLLLGMLVLGWSLFLSASVRLTRAEERAQKLAEAVAEMKLAIVQERAETAFAVAKLTQPCPDPTARDFYKPVFDAIERERERLTR